MQLLCCLFLSCTVTVACTSCIYCVCVTSPFYTFPCVAHDHIQHVFKYNDSEVVLNCRCSPVFVGKRQFPAGHFRELTGKGWHMARQEGGKERRETRRGREDRTPEIQAKETRWQKWLMCFSHRTQVWHMVWVVGGFQPTLQKQGRWQRGGSGGSISLLS